MKLTEIQKQSELWQRIESELKERLQILREKNDGALDIDQTNRTRGSIAMLLEILGWTETTPKM